MGRRKRTRTRRKTKKKQVKGPSSLPNDVIEEIFLRLPLETLIRLKSLSKQWRLTIESRSFAERHLKVTERSRIDHPKVMVITEEDPLKAIIRPGFRPDTDLGFRTFCLESASLLSFTTINFPQGFYHYVYVSQSCDGLFCIYSRRSHSVYVVNPATRWLRQLPPNSYQNLMHKYNPTLEERRDVLDSIFRLAFVKATDYKLVLLYNSDKYNTDHEAFPPHEGPTKCEVFDFRANAWRYLARTPSYRIFCGDQKPAYANSSVYWLRNNIMPESK